MKLDNTLKEILITIQLEVKEKYNVDLSIESIHEVINTQFEATKLGFQKNITVHWSRFCKFVFTNRYERGVEITNFKNKLDIDNKLSPLEKENLLKDYIIEKTKEKKELIKHSSIQNSNSFNIEELNKIEKGKSSKPSFVIINKKHKK